MLAGHEHCPPPFHSVIKHIDTAWISGSRIDLGGNQVANQLQWRQHINTLSTLQALELTLYCMLGMLFVVLQQSYQNHNWSHQSRSDGHTNRSGVMPVGSSNTTTHTHVHAHKHLLTKLGIGQAFSAVSFLFSSSGISPSQLSERSVHSASQLGEWSLLTLRWIVQLL